MKKNTSNTDRVLRFMLAITLIALNLLKLVDSPENLLVWMVAAILVFTSLAGSCPLYSLFGINTKTGKRTV